MFWICLGLIFGVGNLDLVLFVFFGVFNDELIGDVILDFIFELFWIFSFFWDRKFFICFFDILVGFVELVVFLSFICILLLS